MSPALAGRIYPAEYAKILQHNFGVSYEAGHSNYTKRNDLRLFC